MVVAAEPPAAMVVDPHDVDAERRCDVRGGVSWPMLMRLRDEAKSTFHFERHHRRRSRKHGRCSRETSCGVTSTAAITDNTVTTSTLTGNATLGGDIVADANEDIAAVTSNDITVGGGGSTVVAAGKLVGVNCSHHWNTVTTSTLPAMFGGHIVADANEAKSSLAERTGGSAEARSGRLTEPRTG